MKWTTRVIMHFIDLAICNAWVLYRKDGIAVGKSKRELLPLIDFKLQIAEHIGQLEEDSSSEDEEELPRDGIRIPLPTLEQRTKHAKHLPDRIAKPGRCRMPGCIARGRVRCTKCNVVLCMNSNKNCFIAFHTK